MDSDGKLKLLLFRGAIINIAFAAYFFLPGEYGLFVAGFIILGRRFIGVKALSDSGPKLAPEHKRIYFAATSFCTLFWLALLLSWIIRHSSPPAWAMGSLGIIVLLTLLYYSYDTIYGPHAKV
jgi:hypothetical protein